MKCDCRFVIVHVTLSMQGTEANHPAAFLHGSERSVDIPKRKELSHLRKNPPVREANLVTCFDDLLISFLL